MIIGKPFGKGHIPWNKGKKGLQNAWNKKDKIKLICQICEKEFEVCPCHKNAKFCSKKCFFESKKGYKQTEEHKQKIGKALKGHKVTEETRRKIIEANTGRKHSKEARKNMSEAHKGKPSWNKGIKCPQTSGENNYLWKGENCCYITLHSWVVRHKGKPKICEHCGATCKERKLCYANIDHKYRRDLDDFISLCYSCHRKYDYKYNLKPDNKIGTNQYKENYLAGTECP